MGVYLNHPTLPNLYCNEAANEVVSCEADYDDDSGSGHETVTNTTFASLDSNHCFFDYDNDSLSNLFDSEVDQMLEYSKVVSLRFHDNPSIVTARQEAIQWMLKVHSFYMFRPETAYLSINYMDRFLSSRAFPQGKGWPMQLLSVSCLSLAAKMEESRVPMLLDLQIMKPRFLFKPKTVRRMELLVMKTLKWRLRTITPFDFLHCFISSINNNNSQQQNGLCHHLFSSASHLIVNTCKGIDSLDYPPSAIAAAVALRLTNHSVDDQTLGTFWHNRLLNQAIDTDMVKKIGKVIEGKKVKFGGNNMPQSPTGVLEVAALQ